MIEELFNVIKNWPVIVQGAFGSGLFWLVLNIGQKLVTFISAKYSYISKVSRISWLRSASLKYHSTEEDETDCIVALIYRSIRFFYKSILWLTMGLIVNSYIEPFGVIGYIGSIYFLFKAYEVVSPVKEGEDVNKKLEEIETELSKLEKT